MRRRHTIIFLASLSCFAASVRGVDAGTQLERIDYHGWHGCYRLSNGIVELVVAQDIGRIIRYGFIGGENALWEQGDTAGQVSDAKRWVNHGGDKVFPWPQDDWPLRISGNWPPTFSSERQPHSVEVMDGHALRLISPVIGEYGIRIVREISLDAEDAGVTIVNRFNQIDTGPEIPLAVWTVTQVPAGSTYYAGVQAGLSDERTWETLIGLPWPNVKRTDAGFLQLADSPTSAKIEVNAGMLAAVSEKQIFIQSTIDSDVDADHPMERAQMFSAPAVASPAADRRTGYTELEFTSPRKRLLPGDSISLKIRWNLIRRSSAANDDSVAVLLAEQKRKN